MSDVSVPVPIPYVSDLDAYIERTMAKEKAERDKILDFSPYDGENTRKLWKPDDDRLLALFTSIDPDSAAWTYNFLRKMTRGRRKDEPIWLSVNSAGGHAPSGFAMTAPRPFLSQPFTHSTPDSGVWRQCPRNPNVGFLQASWPQS